MMDEKNADTPPPRTRMTPEARRAQLLEVASSLLFEKGVEAVRIPEVAERAGVTRPVVYRFFPSRHAIFIALLEELSDALDTHMEAALATPSDVHSMVTAFIDTTCDAIEACGPGAWLLLGGAALDDEVRGIVTEIEGRLAKPWVERVGRVLRGVDPVVVSAITAMLIAGSRAALGMWLRDEIDRETAAFTLTRAVGGILGEFRLPSDQRYRQP